MTDTAIASVSASAPDTWGQQLARLRVLYKNARPQVLVALNILLHEQNIALDDAKARAALHGVRITAASLNAARSLLSRMNAPPAVKRAAIATTPAVHASAPTPRRLRAPESALDAETLIRGAVARLQAEGTAEAERLRAAIRKAIAVLQTMIE